MDGKFCGLMWSSTQAFVCRGWTKLKTFIPDIGLRTSIWSRDLLNLKKHFCYPLDRKVWYCQLNICMLMAYTFHYEIIVIGSCYRLDISESEPR